VALVSLRIVRPVIGTSGAAATALDSVNGSEELPCTTMNAEFHATLLLSRPRAARVVCLAAHQTKLTANGTDGPTGVLAPVLVVVASALVIGTSRLLPRAEERCARPTIAQKSPHATLIVAVQIAEMENGQFGAIGVNVPTLAEVAHVGVREKSRQRRMSAVNQQLVFRRSMNSATRQFHVPKIQIVSLGIGVLGVIAHALAMV